MIAWREKSTSFPVAAGGMRSVIYIYINIIIYIYIYISRSNFHHENLVTDRLPHGGRGADRCGGR